MLSFVTDCPFFTQGYHSCFMLITTLSFILLCKEVRLPTFFTIIRLQTVLVINCARKALRFVILVLYLYILLEKSFCNSHERKLSC